MSLARQTKASARSACAPASGPAAAGGKRRQGPRSALLARGAAPAAAGAPAGVRAGGRPLARSSRPLSAAAIRRPSEPRGGHNPPAFGSPAASPRHRWARLGSQPPGFPRPGAEGGRPAAGAAAARERRVCPRGWSERRRREALPRPGRWAEGTEAEVRGAAGRGRDGQRRGGSAELRLGAARPGEPEPGAGGSEVICPSGSGRRCGGSGRGGGDAARTAPSWGGSASVPAASRLPGGPPGKLLAPFLIPRVFKLSSAPAV